MLAHILGLQAPTLATQGNYNNEIGVPLTALAIGPEHHYAVVEMGAARKGDIAYLCDCVKPSVALITNAGDAHIEGFGSTQGIAEGKGEIYQALNAGDTALINADSPFADYWAGLAPEATIRRFGCSSAAEVRAINIQSSFEGSEFELQLDGESLPVNLGLPGHHNIENALAAAAAAAAVGLNLRQIVSGLNSFDGVASRLAITKAANGATLINDSYNANPSAFKAAIDVLASAEGETVLVMGDMAELGSYAEQAHHDIGAYAKTAGIHRLLATGDLSRAAVSAFGSGGTWYQTKTTLAEDLLGQLQDQHTILVKGSRSAAMETVVEQIAGAQTPAFSGQRGSIC